MKKFSSNIFGEIPQPESFEELLAILVENKNQSYFNVLMWRGQSNIDWRIDHSAYRRLILEGKRVTEDRLTHYEEVLLAQATHKGFRYQDGRCLSDFELLAKLQHHGAATRLLDFTRNCMVALWFCANKDKDKTGLLIGLHCEHLGGYESQGNNAKYAEHIRSISSLNHPQTWESPVVTPRISAQHSQFIYSALSLDKRGSVRISDDDGAALFIAISPEMKTILDRYLEQLFDLRAQTLFPDIDGFGFANSHLILEGKMWRW